MSYDELVGELYLVASNVTSERRKNLLVRAAEAIEELSKSKWIKVESRELTADGIEVTHWAPLPEPPEEVGK